MRRFEGGAPGGAFASPGAFLGVAAVLLAASAAVFQTDPLAEGAGFFVLLAVPGTVLATVALHALRDRQSKSTRPGTLAGLAIAATVPVAAFVALGFGSCGAEAECLPLIVAPTAYCGVVLGASLFALRETGRDS